MIHLYITLVARLRSSELGFAGKSQITFQISSFVYSTERALCRPLEALECLSSGSGIGRRLLEMLAIDIAENI